MNKWEKTVVHALKSAIRAQRGLYGHRLTGIYDAFDRIDKDGNNAISPLEFAEALHRLDIGLTESQIVELIQMVDLDGDGNINFDEFCRILELSPEERAREEAERQRRIQRREGRKHAVRASHAQVNQNNGTLESKRDHLAYAVPPRRRYDEDEEDDQIHFASSPATRAYPPFPPPTLPFAAATKQTRSPRPADEMYVNEEDLAFDRQMTAAEMKRHERALAAKWSNIIEQARQRKIVQDNLATSTAPMPSCPPPPPALRVVPVVDSPSTGYLSMQQNPMSLLPSSSSSNRILLPDDAQTRHDLEASLEDANDLSDRALRVLARVAMENVALLRTLRAVAASELETSNPTVIRSLDLAMLGSNHACDALRCGGRGVEEMLERLEIATKTRYSLAQTLREVELCIEKEKQERRFRWRRALAKELERSTHARDTAEKLRAQLVRNVGVPANSSKGTVVPTESRPKSMRRADVVPRNGSSEVVATSMQGHYRRRAEPTHLTVQLPDDWDGRSIEISVSEDEYTDASGEEDGGFVISKGA